MPHCAGLYVGLRRATRRDFTDNGWTPPRDWEDDPPYGQPGHPRQKIGTELGPLVSLRPPVGTRERDVLDTRRPVRDPLEVERWMAEGWAIEWTKP